MAQSAGEAARAVSEVSSNVQGVSNAASDSSRGVRQVNESAGDLAKMAGEIQEMMRRFKVEAR